MTAYGPGRWDELVLSLLLLAAGVAVTIWGWRGERREGRKS